MARVILTLQLERLSSFRSLYGSKDHSPQSHRPLESLLFQQTAHFKASSSKQNCLLQVWHTAGDSRDKYGIDEVGGTDGGGRGLPGPQQWVEVAAVQYGLVMHGVGWGTGQPARWTLGSGVSAVDSALWRINRKHKM